MLTAILVILSIDLFLRLLQVGGSATVTKTLTAIEMNTRGYGK